MTEKGFALGRLRFGPIGPRAVHLCVDMQRLFQEDTPWRTPWMDDVLPRVTELAGHSPASTIFTRFIPARRPGDGKGVWSRYWMKWADMTLEHVHPDLIELVPSLQIFAPPALVLDKTVYSPWVDNRLDAALASRGSTTLIVTGGETDVCVLATVLGAVDRGYRVIVVKNAICSSSDATHDAALTVYAERYSEHVEAVDAEEVLSSWSPD